MLTDSEKNAAGKNSSVLMDYFDRNGAPCPADTNPAEHMVEVIQGKTGGGVNWVDVWSQSPERKAALELLQKLNQQALTETSGESEDDGTSFATTKMFQLKMVLHRQMVQLWRSPVWLLQFHRLLHDADTQNVGLCLEQDQSARIRFIIQWIYILDGRKRNFLSAVEDLLHLQLHLCGPGLYQPDAAFLPQEQGSIRDPREESEYPTTYTYFTGAEANTTNSPRHTTGWPLLGHRPYLRSRISSFAQHYTSSASTLPVDILSKQASRATCIYR